MISFSVVKSFVLEKFERVLKVNQFGLKTATQVSSFGDDSAPIKDMIAIYAQTTEVSDNIIIGYINKNQIASPGEKRIFSLNPDGSFSCAIHLKAQGNIEIGEAADFAVRFTPLDAAIKVKDGLVNAELAKIAVVLNTIVPGSYVPGTVITDLTASMVQKTKI